MSRFFVRAWVLVPVLWALTLAVAHGQVIVDAEYVQRALQRQVQIWDVRPEAAFARAHLPGALSVGNAAAVLRDANTENFLPADEVAAILGAAGIDPARETIVYGSRGAWQAYLGRYALRYFGATRVHVFHDGMEAWQEAGLPVETGAARPQALQLELTPNPAVTADIDEVLARLGRPEVQIVDARTPREYAGADIRALRGGHIPGAVNIPYEMNWIDPQAATTRAAGQAYDSRGMALKERADLEALYAGLDPERETIVYCQSGARASETAGLLEHLGFRNVRVFESSWLGWGNRLDAPASNETVINMGALKRSMAALQERVEALEKALAASAE